MKSIIKKYSKRIIITALVILLIAVVGTVKNYRTYRSAEIGYMDEEAYEYLREIYGDGLVLEVQGRRANVYYVKHKKYDLRERIVPGHNTQVLFSIDAEKYSPDDIVRVELKNSGLYSVELSGEQYLLQVKLNGRWYTVHTGELGANSYEQVTLSDGESYSFDIPLNSVREVVDGEFELKKGEYCLCKKVWLTYYEWQKEEYVADIWLGCEFEVI